MLCIYYDDNIKATFTELTFDTSVSEPVKVTTRVEKQNKVSKYKFLQNVVLFYNVRTQEVWMDDESECADSLCDFVKSHMDTIFSDSQESEKKLVEILCQTEDILLGRYMTPDYSLYYKQGLYELVVPIMTGGGVPADKFDELCNRVNGSALSRGFAWTLNWIPVKDPSFLNQKYMIRREPGKRNGTNVVREFQRRVEAVAKKAEECIRVRNAYRESM